MYPTVGMLGPLEARIDGQPVHLEGSKPQRLLGMLLLHLGRAVSTDRLVEAIWEDTPPPSATVTLRSHVATLRRALSASPADVLLNQPPGYLLDLPPEQVDAVLFERFVEQGRAALDVGDPNEAARTLRQGLGLWRGPVLEGLGSPRFAEAETHRLEGLRLNAVELRIQADLELGRHRELVGELEALTGTHPFREPLWRHLMLALHRSGRTADALAAYRTAYRRFDEELGLAPSDDLAGLEAAILRRDPSLAAPAELGGTAPRGSSDRAAGGGPTRTEPAAGPDRHPPSPALHDLVRRNPMVGRDEELTRLQELWRAVCGGARRIALVAGEAGIGKTRLVAELAREVSASGAVVLLGHGEHNPLVPYGPITDALRSHDLVTETLERCPASVQRQLDPLIGSPAAAGRAHPTATSPTSHREELLAAVVELLDRLTRSSSTLLLIEDAERIDHASAHLLRYLASHLPERLMLTVCFRDPPGSLHLPLLDLLADFEGRGLSDRVDLAPFDVQQLAALVVALTGSETTATFLRTLSASTGGNPFFAGEVVRDLAAGTRLGDSAATWQVPAGVRDVLRQRLHDLTPHAREVVGCAAVLGHQASLRLLAEVARRSVEEVGAGIDECTRAGCLQEQPDTRGTRYAFRHALMRHAVLVDLPAPRRQQWHLRAAAALDPGDELRPTDLTAAAAHLRAAGDLADPEHVAATSLRAADAAAEVFAWDEAVDHAEAALAARTHAGAPPADQAAAAEHAAELLIRSGLDPRRAVRHFETALAHRHHGGDEAAAARVGGRLGYVLCLHHSVMDVPRALDLLDGSGTDGVAGDAAFEHWFGRCMALSFAVRSDEGVRTAARAVAEARAVGREDLVARVRPTEALHRANRGELSTAHALLEDSWSVARRLHDPHLGWEPAGTGAVIHNLYLLDPAGAEHWCRRGLEQRGFDTLAQAYGAVNDHLILAGLTQGWRAETLPGFGDLAVDAVSRRVHDLLEGRWEEAERSWHVAMTQDLARGDLLNALFNAHWLGRVQWWLDRRQAAHATFERGLELLTDEPQLPMEISLRVELARILAQHGDVDAADSHVERCEAVVTSDEDWRGQVGAVELARAAVAAGRGDVNRADRAHDRAVEVFDHYGLPWRRAEALLAWAGWQRRSGRDDRARATYELARRGYVNLDAAERWLRVGQPHEAT